MKMKKIFSISMVKNEVDIIETFIRYHVSIFDGMVILDNGSTDGTVDVISKLINEGLPVYLSFDYNPAYNQSEITTTLFYKTVDEFYPDFILPLDVDEFITSPNHTNLRYFLDNKLSEDGLSFLSWISYVPSESDNQSEENFLKRIGHRRNEQGVRVEKVVIPVVVGVKNKIKIKQGNHDLEVIDGVVFEKKHINDIGLAHYPIRSLEQAKSKYLVGWLANLARPKQVLFDWYYYYNIIKSGRSLNVKDLQDMALFYGADRDKPMEMVNNPIDLSLVKEFDLIYSGGKFNYVNNILNYSELLAGRYSAVLNFAGEKIKNEVSNYFKKENEVMQEIKDFILIDGWLNPVQAIELYNTAKSIKGDNLTLVEIGSWLGRSSYVLAKALLGKNDSILYCVDPFDCGDVVSETLYKKEMNQLPDKSLLNKFNKNIAKFGVTNLIKVIPEYSFNAIKTFDKGIDFLFIDGNHDYDSVFRDYEQWSPLVKKGGYIAFHDVGAGHTFGPKQVVEKYIVHNPDWINQKFVEELYIAQRK